MKFSCFVLNRRGESDLPADRDLGGLILTGSPLLKLLNGHAEPDVIHKLTLSEEHAAVRSFSLSDGSMPRDLIFLPCQKFTAMCASELPNGQALAATGR